MLCARFVKRSIHRTLSSPLFRDFFGPKEKITSLSCVCREIADTRFNTVIERHRHLHCMLLTVFESRSRDAFFLSNSCEIRLCLYFIESLTGNKTNVIGSFQYRNSNEAISITLAIRATSSCHPIIHN